MPSFAILELKPNNYSQSNMNIADLKRQKRLLPRGQELSGESRTRIRMGYHNWRCQSSQKATGKSDPDENSTLALDPWDIHFSVNFQHSLSPKSWSMFLQSASSWGGSMSGKPVYFIPSRWFYPEEHHVNGALAPFLIFLYFTEEQHAYYLLNSLAITRVTYQARPPPCLLLEEPRTWIHGSRFCSRIL